MKAKYSCDRCHIHINEEANSGHQQLTCKYVFSFEKINPEIVQSTLPNHFQFPKGNKNKTEEPTKKKHIEH